MIKSVFIIALSLGVIACGNSKEVDVSTDVTPAVDTVSTSDDSVVINTETSFVDGTIADRKNGRGCQYIIQVTINGNDINLEPGELDEKFKVDGKAVQLKYASSKRQSLCDDTMPIMIIEIK